MSPKHQQRLALDQLDLAGVLARLQAKDGFEVRRAEKTVAMYKRFLKMAQENPGEIIVPNEDVDTAWHHHILDTQAYARDCQALFGQFLHHNPHFYGTDAFFEACDKTQALYEKSFGAGNTFVDKTIGIATATQPGICGGMLKDDSETNLQAAICGGMLKEDVVVDLKPGICGGMLKDDVVVDLKPGICGGMLTEEVENNLKAAICGGMLKDDGEVNLKAGICGGMLKADDELHLKPQLKPDALFQAPANESTVH